MNPIVVVGAGISGVTCARTLERAGLPVVVLDRGHVPGGRLASRTIDGRPVDVGASYFTVSDPRFAEQVERWRVAGLAHPWTDTFAVLAPGEPVETKQGPMRWGATRGLRSLVETMAGEVRRSTVEQVRRAPDGALRVDGVTAAAVVLAMPDPQARRLLGAGLEAAAALLDVEYEPVLALTTRWDARPWELDAAFVHDDPVIDWVADDGRRRGDGAPVLVAHSTPGFAARHLDRPEDAVEAMVDALRGLLGTADRPSTSAVQRWTFAKPVPTHASSYLLTPDGLGACGDAWTSVPKVEGAFLSGLELGEALVRRLA